MKLPVTLQPVTLQPVTRDHLPAFHAVMMAAGMDARSSWSRTTVADLEGSLFAEGAGGFVALDGGGEVIGCVGFRPDGSETLTLNKLATLPAVRGQGWGAGLVEAVELEAMRRGFQRVLLAVSQYNLEVVPFYEKLGYIQTDEVYAFANPSSPKPVVMVKEIGRSVDPEDAVSREVKRIQELKRQGKTFWEIQVSIPRSQFNGFGRGVILHRALGLSLPCCQEIAAFGNSSKEELYVRVAHFPEWQKQFGDEL